MERSDEILLHNMLKAIIVYGIIVQVVLLFLPVERMTCSMGLWIGIAAGCGMLVHIRNSLNEALDLSVEDAQRQIQKSYGIRTTAVVAICFAVVYFGLANIVTLLIGLMGIKISAFVQPIMDSLKK